MGKYNKGRSKVEQNIEVINKQLDRATEKAEEATSAMAKFLEQRGLSMRDDKGETNLDYARGEVEKLNQPVEKSKSAFQKLKESAKECFDSIGKGSKKSDGFLQKFTKRIVSLAKRVFVFSIIARAFRSMVKALQDGLKNFAQYSKEYNKVMSEFKSQTATLKNNLATAFAPIVQKIVPYLSLLVSWLNIAIQKLSAFFSALNGKSTFVKAKKQVIDYAKAVGDASNKLASFDDIQVLDQGGGGNGELTGADAFETEEIEDKVKTFADNVRAILDSLKESLSTWWGDLDFEPLINSFQRLKDACAPIVESIGDGLLWVLENVLEPLGSFVIEDALPHFFDMLTSAVNLCKKAFEVLKPSLSFIWEELFVPFGRFLGEVFVNTMDNIKEVFESFGDMLVSKGDSINKVIKVICGAFQLMSIVGRTTIQFLMGVVTGFLKLIIKAFGSIVDVFSDLIDFVVNIFKGEWEEAFKSLGNVAIDLLNLVIDAVEGALNAVIKGINSLSFEVPDWVPGIGGKTIGFNLPEFSWGRIPRLATGGITDRPTFAQIGENGREAVLPLENNTEWMDILADRIGSGNVTIKFDGSLAQLARVLNPVLDAENTRIGTKLVVE